MQIERHFLVAIGLLAGAALARAQATEPPVTSPPPPPVSGSGSAPPTELPAPAPSATFHDALAPHGTWTTLAPYGEVWVPKDMPAGWRPYTTGHWVFADESGWTWVADEPWGWAPFHYGRWTLDATLGWVWIPGDVWAPAWVAWRQGEGFTGWAPLPPSVAWRVGIGLDFGSFDVGFGIADPWWSFVPVGCLCHPRVREVILVPERTVVVLHHTTLVRNIAIERGRPVNRAVEVAEIERASGAPVQHVVLHEIARPEAIREAPLADNEVAVVRPREAGGARVTEAPRATPPRTEPPPRPLPAPTHYRHARHRWNQRPY